MWGGFKARDRPSVFAACVMRPQTPQRTGPPHTGASKHDEPNQNWRFFWQAASCKSGILLWQRKTSSIFFTELSVWDWPVEEWVRAVDSHGPSILGQRRGDGVCAAVLIHTGGQLVSQSKLLWEMKETDYEQLQLPKNMSELSNTMVPQSVVHIMALIICETTRPVTMINFDDKLSHKLLQ